MSGTRTDLLHSLSAGDAAAVMALGAPVSLRSGSVLFQLGDEADRVFLVDRGRVELTLPMRIRDREEDVLLEEKGPGETLGWSGLIPPHRFTLKAKATIESELFAFPR